MPRNATCIGWIMKAPNENMQHKSQHKHEQNNYANPKQTCEHGHGNKQETKTTRKKHATWTSKQCKGLTKIFTNMVERGGEAPDQIKTPPTIPPKASQYVRQSKRKKYPKSANGGEANGTGF